MVFDTIICAVGGEFCGEVVRAFIGRAFFQAGDLSNLGEKLMKSL